MPFRSREQMHDVAEVSCLLRNRGRIENEELAQLVEKYGQVRAEELVRIAYDRWLPKGAWDGREAHVQRTLYKKRLHVTFHHNTSTHPEADPTKGSPDNQSDCDNRLEHPPGFQLLGFARFVCGRKYYENVIEEMYEQTCLEWVEAEAKGDRLTSRALRVRFWCWLGIAVAQRPITWLLKQIAGAFRGP